MLHLVERDCKTEIVALCALHVTDCVDELEHALHYIGLKLPLYSNDLGSVFRYFLIGLGRESNITRKGFDQPTYVF